MTGIYDISLIFSEEKVMLYGLKFSNAFIWTGIDFLKIFLFVESLLKRISLIKVILFFIYVILFHCLI